MALMEYCLVNIVLGDTALPKPIPPPPPPEPPKPEKTLDYAPPKVILYYLPIQIQAFNHKYWHKFKK